MKNLIYLSILFTFACTERREIPTEPVKGAAPVYSFLTPDEIRNDELNSSDSLGVLFFHEQYVLVSETNKGIHVVNNENPASPQKVAFWSVPGIKDFSIKDRFLFAENGRDLLTIDISNMDAIFLHDINENIHSDENLLFPKEYTGWFECVDEERGTILRWEEKLLNQPHCWR